MTDWNTVKNDRNALRRLYVEEGLSMAKIAAKFGVSTQPVFSAIHAHNIGARGAHGRRTVQIGKRELERLYQDHSMAKIAEMYGCGETVIFKRLKEYGISVKGHEAHGHRTKTRVFSDRHVKNLRKAAKARRGKYAGENSPHWKGGATEANLQARRSGAYREWKNAVLDRVGHKCQSCGLEKGAVCKCCGQKATLHVHHIKPFAEYPELRFEPSNGRVLCAKCHYQLHH